MRLVEKRSARTVEGEMLSDRASSDAPPPGRGPNTSMAWRMRGFVGAKRRRCLTWAVTWGRPRAHSCSSFSKKMLREASNTPGRLRSRSSARACRWALPSAVCTNNTYYKLYTHAGCILTDSGCNHSIRNIS